MLNENARRLPPLGGINGRGSPVSLERLLAEKVDAVVDVGVVSEATVSTARQTAKRLGAPYLLLEGRLAQSAEQIRQLGGLIASPHTERLAALAEQALAFAQREAAARSRPVSVYLARGRAMRATRSQAAAWRRFPSNKSSCGSPTGFSPRKPILPFR